MAKQRVVLEPDEVVYVKRNGRYVPYGNANDVKYDIAPCGIEMVVRDGTGSSRYWRFASLESVQHEYDLLHESMRHRLGGDLASIVQREWPDFAWTGKSLNEVCERITDYMLAETLKDARKLRSW